MERYVRPAIAGILALALSMALAGPPSPAGGYVWARDDPERRRLLYEAMERELGVGRDGLEAAWNARRRGKP